jgi:nitroimidazol reductase NimA-like FMN-containing flavoprotein (pyridoxamine 5'-phosphate oxidase superfamily)
MTARIKGRLVQIETPEEGVVVVPFAFVVNGTSDPDGLQGDELVSVTRSEAGEFLCTLRNKPAICFFGDAGVSNTADDVDLYAKVDWSSVVSDGTFVVRAMTAATQTDPTDNLKIGGFLLLKKTTRVARG